MTFSMTLSIEYCYAECREYLNVMLNVIQLSVIMLNLGLPYSQPSQSTTRIGEILESSHHFHFLIIIEKHLKVILLLDFSLF